MNLTCTRCSVSFDAATFRGYCDGCVALHREAREAVHAKQRPAPNIYADGKFADPATCPKSVTDPVSGKTVCPLCGSDEIEPGYGLGGGYGMGSYTFCFECDSFLDFHEDTE